MTIASTVARNNYLGSGTVGPFAYAFRVFAATDLVVTQMDLAGVETTLLYPSAYAVSGVGNASGSITLTTALPSGYALAIRRVVAPLQPYDIKNQGPFFAGTHEDAFDHVIMAMQTQQDTLNRSLVAPATEASIGALPSAASRANKLLAFDGTGQPLASAITIGATGAVGISTFWSSVVTTTTQALAQAALGITQLFLGPYYPTGVSELGVTNNTYPVGHFHRYGASGNGSSDDLAAVNAAIVAAPSGSTITGIPGKVYALSATPTITKALTIDGQFATLKALGAMNAVGLTTDLSGIQWKNWTVDCNGFAKSGLMSVANTVGPVGVSFQNCHAINMATDHTLIEAGIRVTTAGGATTRHKDVTVDNCSAKNGGTSGCYIYYTDGAKLTNWTGDTLDNHSYEFAFCTDFLADTITSSYCGGSGAACGAQSYHGVMKGIVANYCFGDAAITVENTSADVRVSDFMLRNCWKAGLSANFGEAGHPFPNDVMRGVHFSNGTARSAVPVVITGATKANPCKLTVPSHGIKTIYLSNTVQVSLAGIVGMVTLNGTTPTVTSIDPGTGIHNPNALWLVGVDSTGYGAYVSGGTVSSFCNGSNTYGGVPAVSPNISLADLEFNDFNCGLAMLYMDGAECRNIRVNGLQGPNSAVARWTYCTNPKIESVSQSDANHQPTDPLGAFQFLNQTGTANACNHVTATELSCLQSGATSNLPLIYTEGSGDYTFNDPTTGGASTIVSTRAAADTPTIRINSPTVTLSTVTPYLAGAGSTPVWIVDYPRIPRSIGAANGTATYYDGTLDFDCTAGSRTLTLPKGATMVGKQLVALKIASASGANNLTISATAPDALSSTVFSTAATEQAATLEAYVGGWRVIALR